MPADTVSNRATHPALHIRNAHEAHTLFEAVRLGHLPIVRRRLSPTDRELQSGEVFVWEEASYKGGLERWTDGRKWSQSRMREPFLFYEEKAMPSREEKDAKAARRARKSSDPGSPGPIAPSSPTPRRQDRPTKVKGLTKQTYSAYVTPPGSAGPPKKWHLTAYFCSTSYHELPVVSDDPILRNIVVPADVYVTGKGLTRKNNSARGVGSAHSNGGPSRPASTAPIPPTATLPPPPPAVAYDAYAQHHQQARRLPPPPLSASTPTDDARSRSPWSSSSDSASMAMPITPPPQPPVPSALPYPQPHYPPPQPANQYYAPYPTTAHYDAPTPTSAPPHSPVVVYDVTPRPSSTLPPLRYDEPPKSAIPPPPHQQYAPPPSSAAVSYPSSDVRGTSPPSPPSADGPRYSARHSLDQRALGAFRLAL